MFESCKRRWLSRLLRAAPPDDASWRRLRRELPLLHPLSVREAVRLRVLTTRFLHDKRLSGAHGLEVTPWMAAVVASQACLPVLHLGLDAYAGWHEVILYPSGFRVHRAWTDDSGVVHETEAPLSGEAWERGPVVLAWDRVERESFELIPGRHLVIHEFAHKLDAANGRINGMPPLHPDMPLDAWARTLSRAWERLQQQLAKHRPACIDPYAATDPAEFFAVVSEYFFTAPGVLVEACPEVYGQLQAYYRQDPLIRYQSLR